MKASSPTILTPLYRAGLVAWKDSLVQFQSPILVVFVVAMPLAMVLITGLAFKGYEQPAPADGAGGDLPGFSSWSQAVAGNGVMFILMNCIMSGAFGLIKERRHHTLDRLLISPLSRGSILLGKTLGIYLLGLAQAVVIFGFGLVLGVRLGNVVGVVLVTLVFILVGCSLGLMIAGLAKREENVQLMGAPIGLVMTALGGGMFPVEKAPAWMQTLSLAFPTGWAMQAYHMLMFPPPASCVAVLPHLLVLLGFSAVFFLVGVLSLRWE